MQTIISTIPLELGFVPHSFALFTQELPAVRVGTYVATAINH